MKKILAILLTLSALTSTAFATTTDFTDIQGHWAYDAIETAIDLGLFSGKSATVFDPDSTITKAEFITVVMRAVASDVDTSSVNSDWWSGSYYAAVDAGIITTAWFPYSSMTDVMTREEMGFVLTEALEYTGEALDTNIDSSRIPDYYEIGSSYRSNVLVAYSNGLLAGKDTVGTFDPDGTLSRAQACTVLARLVDESLRTDVQSDAEYYASQASTVQTIYEGQTHEYAAKAGDIYVKADGTTIVLEYGENGILGENQGISADLGLYCSTSGSTVIANSNVAWGSQGYGTTGSGYNVATQYYLVNNLTGEGHWSSDWSAMNLTKPSYSGTYLGELSEDQNWVWMTSGSDWQFVPGYDVTWEMINSVN